MFFYIYFCGRFHYGVFKLLRTEIDLSEIYRTTLCVHVEMRCTILCYMLPFNPLLEKFSVVYYL